MARTREVHKFKEGQKFTLDDIYDIQALAGGNWWERTGDDISDDNVDKQNEMDMSESLICTRTVTITIIVDTP